VKLTGNRTNSQMSSTCSTPRPQL